MGKHSLVYDNYLHGRWRHVQWRQNFDEKSFIENKHEELTEKGIQVTPKILKLHTGGKVTVKKFIRNFPKGTFLVTVRRHAFAIIDGQVYGNSDDGRRLSRELRAIYKIEKP